MIDAAKLELYVVRQYDKQSAELDQKIREWMEKKPKLVANLDKWLNQMTMEAAAEATARAVHSRASSVNLRINISKLCERAYHSAKTVVQQQLNPDEMRYAMELMAEDAGYVVENHCIVFELELLPLEEDDLDAPQLPDGEDEELDIGSPPESKAAATEAAPSAKKKTGKGRKGKDAAPPP